MSAMLDAIPGTPSVTRGSGFHLASDMGGTFKGFKRGFCPGRDFNQSFKCIVSVRQSRGGSVRRRGGAVVASPVDFRRFQLSEVRAVWEPCEDDARSVGVPSAKSALVVGGWTPVVDAGPQLALFQCLTLGFSAGVPKGVRLGTAGCVTYRLWWLVSLHCSWLVVVERKLDLSSVTARLRGYKRETDNRCGVPWRWHSFSVQCCTLWQLVHVPLVGRVVLWYVSPTPAGVEARPCVLWRSCGVTLHCNQSSAAEAKKI
ncbi:hypothetical protein Taro_023521 [Colocasia esculenta]|uniref:Uncharacterized protein n=1 Tax=Colocasia esculenta TaxID=4460 RepID=A0A843VHL3_COLES|nr:hypothetical protein [Colocasia esculenta]